MNIACKLLRAAGLAATLAASVAAAQTPAPLAAPNVPLALAGVVATVIRQPDGGIVFGGQFSSVNGVPRNNIARLAPDGTLDLDWDPSANGYVTVLAANANGDIFAGGTFTAMGGQPRNLLAKISGSADGAADAEWDATIPEDVFGDTQYVVTALTVDTNGALYVGGALHSIGGVQRACVAKLSGSGGATVDAQWNPPLNGSETNVVAAMALDDSGSIYIASRDPDGSCNTSCIGKFSTSGSGERSADWVQAAAGAATVLAVAQDGALFAAGDFTLPGGARETVKFAAGGNGSVDAGWIPSSLTGVQAIAFDAMGSLYAGGDSGIAKLSTATGTTQADWNVATGESPVLALALSPDGALYAGGAFDHVDNHLALGLTRVAPLDGAVAIAADAELPGSVDAIVRQPNGGTIVGGYFIKAGNSERRYILRLAEDGSLDPDWTPIAENVVVALAAGGDNKVYAAYDYQASAATALVKFIGDGNGAVDPAWNPAVTGAVTTLALDAQGALYAGGTFTRIGGQARQNIAKLSSVDGVADATWDAAADHGVNAIAIDRLGSVYAGGYFSRIGGQARTSIAKLSGISGAADPHWNPSINGYPYAMAAAADGTVYAGGAFDVDDPLMARYVLKIGSDGTVNGQWGTFGSRAMTFALVIDEAGDVFAGGSDSGVEPMRPLLVKLSGATGLRADDWNPLADGSGANALLLDAEGRVFVGGDFTMIDGARRGGLAALPIQPASLLPRGHSRHARTHMPPAQP
ncbi:MAG: delta-60 repeat domain-containing protein [Dokdonella sp.]